MKNLKFSLKTRLACMFLMAMLLSGQEGISQKNSIKITPVSFIRGKTNISYERELNKQWSVIADVQFWFIKDKERNEGSAFSFNFGYNAPSIFETNKGIRYSLAIRKYSKEKKRGKIKTIFYFGGGGFLGHHNIFMERKREVNTYPGLFGGAATTLYPQMLGSADLISGGIYTDLGFQLALTKRMKFEFGLIAGNAWTNQEDDFVILIDQEPYILESEKQRLQEDYSKGILGVYIQPMFNIGFSF